jgi:sialic acid synthase SpsE/D-lyxose ketol-isomerase
MRPLFVFEMANNHMGDVAHGAALIKELKKVTRDFANEFSFAVKFQYRNLDTFIHSSFRDRDDLKYIKRFKETRLLDNDFRELVSVTRASGFRPICTPFDEDSVATIERHEIDVIKIASCSFTDWPLLERIASSNKPIIASTATASLEEIDRVVSFFQHRGKDLTIMHCVAEYPATDDVLHIGQISLLRLRYPDCQIGYSTHESPQNIEAVMIAIAAGATVFEKHVGLPTDTYSLNNYSATPAQVFDWLSAARRAFSMIGVSSRYVPSHAERQNLVALRRGVFAKRQIPAGTVLSLQDVEFAFPASEGQLTANEWSKYSNFTSRVAIGSCDAIRASDVESRGLRDYVGAIVDKVKTLLADARVVVPLKADLEISHHYGIESFYNFGLTMINVVNREYCKKILVLLAGQIHPEQYHQIKEESFLLLYGDVTLVLDGLERQMKVGDVVTIPCGVRHSFSSKGGCIIEEISTTHQKSDSYYTDPAIASNLNRKTILTHWM